MPAWFASYLASSPVVGAEDHQRLVEGITVEVTIVAHRQDAIALELEDQGEVIGVMRVADGGLQLVDIPFQYDGHSYQVELVQTGVGPIAKTTLRRVG